MSEPDQTKAIIDWARRHDDRVDPNNPNADGSGYALFQDRGGLITYCQDASHSNDHLGDLSPG
jgi:predicted glutamine amidotransferase